LTELKLRMISLEPNSMHFSKTKVTSRETS
jgi:hypothetical protein